MKKIKKLNCDFLLDFALKDLRQGAHWVTSYGFQLPWAGLDKIGCNYLQGNCTADSIVEGQIQRFSYPIDIKTMYPVVSKFIKCKK
jgi:hypothetical protein